MGHTSDIRSATALESQQKFTDAGFFILRTPALPSNDFLAWTSGLEATFLKRVASGQERRAAWQKDVLRLRDQLKRQIDRPEVAHALFVASPTLQVGIAHWKNDPDSKKGLQAERALVRYFTRMCTRCTPFGLFSGCSLGRISKNLTEQSQLALSARSSYRTKTRLDYDYLFALTDSLSQDAEILPELRYWPNTSLHKHGNYWHYLECRSGSSGASRSQHLVKVEADTFLDGALARAAGEGASFPDLVTAVRSESVDISDSEAESYLHELIRNKLLISSLVPTVTGQSPLDDLIEQLESSSRGTEMASKLRTVRGKLMALDEKGIGVDTAEYQDITTPLRGVTSETRRGLTYQVDLAKPSDNIVLSAAVLDQVIQAVEVLRRFTITREDEALTNFRKAFMERYERAFVPLLDVLDEQSGIGFGAQTVCESTAIPAGLQLQVAEPERYAELRHVQEFLLDTVISCLRKGSNEVRLKLSDVPHFQSERLQLPTSFCLHVELIAPSKKAFAAGDFQVLVNNTHGPDGARTLTRFCDVEPKLTEPIREYLRNVQLREPDGVLAEVVHLPEGRYGNVLHRPVLRDYEIVFAGRSGANSDRQIPASDLLVTVDENQEICLYSKRLGRRIIPRLTTAHGYFMGYLAPVYRFLGSLQHQNGLNSPHFSWGPLASLSFLPRITVDRVVLAVAQWRLVESEIKDLSDCVGWERFEKVQDLRERKLFPRYVELQESDNTFLVDLDNALSVDAFVHVLSRVKLATVREVFPSFEESCVSSEEGRFCHELEIPLIRSLTGQSDEIQRRPRPASISAFKNPGPSSFAPGSEWLYCKVYGGHSVLDQLLTSHVRALVMRATNESLIDRWFFVRYADPNTHLRLRFHGDPERLKHDLLPQLSTALEPLIRSQTIWKLQFDTYVREVERYGGQEGIDASEDIFRADSDAVLEILNVLEPPEDLDIRWRIAMVGIDMLLDDFDLSDLAALRLLEQSSNYGQTRFHLEKSDKKSLGDHFRKERSALDAIRTGSVSGKVWEIYEGVLRRRSARTRKAVAHLHDVNSTGRLTVPLSDLAKSHIHMHVNRIMSAFANEHELIFYDFLSRLRNSDTARHRTGEVLLGARVTENSYA